jgi:hypothetical protein
MSTFPGSPLLIKGGIALLDSTTGQVLALIPLQYNPDTLTRTMQIKSVSGESGDHIEALRLKGPPIENVKLEAEIDATDLLEKADPQTTQLGIHPQLAILETIIYPTSTHLTSNYQLESTGQLEIAPADGPLTVFIFGPQRIVPVRITELSITEEAFDVALNPIRAKVSLGLRVLTIDDLNFSSKGGSMFMAYLQTKEQLALKNTPGTYSSLGITGLP